LPSSLCYFGCVSSDRQTRFQVAVERDRRRQRRDAPAARDGAVAVEQHGIGHRHRGEEPAHPRVGLGDRDDKQAYVPSGSLREPLQGGQFLPTGLAPGREKVDEDRAGIARGEPVRAAVECGKRECGRRRRPDGEGRGICASIRSKSGERRRRKANDGKYSGRWSTAPQRGSMTCVHCATG